MDIRERILTCQLLSQMKKHPDFSKKVGLEDKSKYKALKESKQ